jgi:hypothetical protein
LNNLIFQSNIITGNFLAAGAINGTGTGLTNSIIKDNVIQGNYNGTNSTLGINLTDTRVLGNNIKENLIYGFTTQRSVNNPAGNVIS